MRKVSFYNVGTGDTTYVQPRGPRFPVTPGAFQTEFGGSFRPGTMSDAFVAKLSPDGTNLVYSTLLGGGSADFAAAIAVDARGNTIVTGWTDSDNFPATPASDQPCRRRQATSLDLPNDTFVAVIDKGGARLAYGTHLDGSGAAAIAVSASGRIYAPLMNGSPPFYRYGIAMIDPGAPAGPPRLACVANAANYVSPGSVAPAEIVSIFGERLEGASEVSFDELSARVLFAGPNQINAVVPAAVA